MNWPVPFPDYISGFRSRVINGILDLARSLQPLDSADIKWTRTPSGFEGRVRSEWASTADVRAFRWEKTAPTDIKIYGGEIQIGEQAAVAVADTTVTISADQSYVGWRYTKSTKVLTIVNFSTSMPHTPGAIEKWLYLFGLTGGAVTLASDGTLNAVFPAAFGDA